MNVHPAPEELRSLVSRTLDALDDEDPLLQHLSRCDACFQVYEGLWAEMFGDLPELTEMFLDSSASRRIEGRLFRRIHVASLGAASVWLVTEGFLRVVLGVLLPIVGSEQAPVSSTTGEES